MIEVGRCYRWQTWPDEMYIKVDDIKAHRVYGMTYNWDGKNMLYEWSCTKDQEKYWVDVTHRFTPLYKILNS